MSELALVDAPALSPDVSIVIPCLNEADSISACVAAAHRAIERTGLTGEVIVVDNGSDDGSGDIARAAGAEVVYEPRRGYGNAYLAGFGAADGDYIVMADADLTYDFDEVPHFIDELGEGAELVVGNRTSRPGAMPWLSRIGNPLLSGFLNLLYRTNVRDAHCGMRAVRREALARLDLRAAGMEFASEMVIRAAREQLDVREVQIELHPRVGRSKLSPFRDGWRHLRLMLVYNPNFLFLAPALLMLLAGVAVTSLVLLGSPVFGRSLQVHSLIGGCLLIVLGVQAIGLGICARAYGVYFIRARDPVFERLQTRFALEHGLLFAAALIAGGIALLGVVFWRWASRDFGSLSEEKMMVVAATVIVVGVQVFFTSFLVSILGLRRHPHR